jgi:hypothetical protein
MVEAAHERASHCHPDSLSSALFDWFALGLSAGIRLSEWAQHSQYSVACISGKNSLPVAVIRSDVTFFDRNHHVLNDIDLSSGGPPPAFARLRWRVQKNGNNGETQPYAASGTVHCPVLALVRITQRACRLSLGPNLPLSIYTSQLHAMVRYIDDSAIALSLQSLAQTCYGPLDHASLNRFSTHSIRVGACVVLNAAGKAGAFIQQRLRWRSEAFLMYLRDIPELALAHAAVLTHANSYLVIAPMVHSNL